MTRFNDQSQQGNPGYVPGHLVVDVDLTQWSVRAANLSGYLLFLGFVKSTLLRGDPELLSRIRSQPILLQDEAHQTQVRIELGGQEFTVQSIVQDVNSWPPHTGIVIQVADPACERLAEIIYRGNGNLMQLEEALPFMGVKVSINSYSRLDEAARVQFSCQDDPDLATLLAKLAVWAGEWDPQGTFSAVGFACQGYEDAPALAKDLPGEHPVAIESEDDWRALFEGFELFLTRYEAGIRGEGSDEEQSAALEIRIYFDEVRGQSDRQTVRTDLFPTVGAFDPLRWEVKKLG